MAMAEVEVEIPGTNGTKPKIPLRRIPSDDCIVYADGDTNEEREGYAIHEGEWIDVVPVHSVLESLAFTALRNSVFSEASMGERNKVFEESFDDLADEMSKRIVSWNWTDIMGEEMEQPYRRPDILKLLTNREFMWLVDTIGYETKSERKND